ncbi:hypothetical protein ACP4OV_029499 [Aristida adscensionis]
MHQHRGYLEADIIPEPSGTTKPIRIATAQLERPDRPSTMYCMERYVQAEHAVAALSSAENVVFGGDMSWDDHTDLPFPLASGWVDAWNAAPVKGKAYIDGINNGNTCEGDWIERIGVGVGGSPSGWIGPRKRSDRFVCKLRDYELKGIELIGRYDQAGAGVQYYQLDRKDNFEFRPSCHDGLILTIAPGQM